MQDVLLSVNDLRTEFLTNRGSVKAVDGISFEIKKGQKIGLVGESGCGKSATALTLMRLIPSNSMERVSGNIMFQGEDLLLKDRSELRKIRGKEIAMIFQDPMTSFDPVFKIGDQIAETILIHKEVSRAVARERVIELLRLVQISYPEQVMESYPHQLSGGMRQRAMIAMALACEPKLLIADEPTTSLDVSIQAQIINLVKDISYRKGTSLLWITHDLGVVAHLCEKIIVMYAGKLVEMADTDTLFENPLHPYTQALLRLAPRLTRDETRQSPIPGSVPNLIGMPTGCKFKDRCSRAMEVCTQDPEWREIEDGHWVSCHLY